VCNADNNREGRIDVLCGDVIDVLADYEDETFTACFCDPPYGLQFMGKRWDHGVPGVPYWAEVLRVLKPGAVLLAFGGTRTWHRLACAIEDAGFEIYDTLMWLHGSGFPKSHDISKAIDREAGAKRDIIGAYRVSGNALTPTKVKGGTYGVAAPNSPPGNIKITAPATPDAVTWHGYGTALKPAVENVIVARKPKAPFLAPDWCPIFLARKPRTSTYAQTAVEHGTAALNIDGCRIATDDVVRSSHNVTIGGKGIYGGGIAATTGALPGQGRWPANLLLDEDAAAMLDEQSGENVSRFFYCAKAARRERDAGLEGMEKKGLAGHNKWTDVDYRKGNGEITNAPHANYHPTVKPIALCEYLARLILPPEAYRDEATLLVPFAGSGSEMIGAWQAGWRNILGIELNDEYCQIARARLAHWTRVSLLESALL